MSDKRDFKDDLSLMQTAYGVSLVLAFRNAVDTLYELQVDLNWQGRISIVKLLMSIVLMLTMVRFFWAVGNIRRFVTRNAARLKKTRRYVVSFHFLTLLVHAFFLFALSKYTKDITLKTDLDAAEWFLVVGYTTFLTMNAAWLWLLIRRQQDRSPEIVWIVNNASTAVVGLLVFAVASAWSPFFGFLGTIAVLTVNCILDLVLTASSYVAIEDTPKLICPILAEQAHAREAAAASGMKSEAHAPPA